MGNGHHPTSTTVNRTPGEAAAQVDTSVAHPARVYNYLLGGKDNFAADRLAAERGVAANRGSEIAPRANREFLLRAVSWLAADAGIRQFIDIGTGIPTSPNVHEAAQEIAPESRVLYVDDDPIVLTHARALLASSPEGHTDYLDADLRDPEHILEYADRALDLNSPVALLLAAVLHFVGDESDPHAIVRRLMDGLPIGSYLVLTHLTGDYRPDEWAVIERIWADQGHVMRVRPHDQVEEFFAGTDLLDPGVSLVHHWRPGADDLFREVDDARISIYAGVGRKP